MKESVANNMKEKLSIIVKTKIFAIYFYGKDNLISLIKGNPKVLSSEETVDKIIKDKCSVSRFGDGEFKLLIQSADLKFQNRSDKLSRRLEEVLRSEYNNLIVCIPKVFSKKDLALRTKQSSDFWRKHVATYRLKWYEYLNLKKVYYNASFTRNYMALKDKSNSEEFFNKVKKIWQDRNLLIVEGKFSRIGVGNDLFSNAASIERILAPHENAFEKYEDILKVIEKQSKEKLILIALGPTATVLAYDLNKAGYQAIDIGHLDVEFEWFLKKATTKTKLDNKYVIEADGRIISDDFKDKRYEEQILAKII